MHITDIHGNRIEFSKYELWAKISLSVFMLSNSPILNEPPTPPQTEYWTHYKEQCEKLVAVTINPSNP